jgi:beta-N-acetylhexosaminidase
MSKVVVPSTSLLHTDVLNQSAATHIADALSGAGIFFNFAPVYDYPWALVGTKKKSFMEGRMYYNIRTSFPAHLADAFATAMWEHGIIPTAKHFPGHGSVVGDSHKQTVTLTVDKTAVDLPETTQFMNAIGHGVPVIMVGHIIVRGSEWDTAGLPSTLSPRIMKELLRNKLGFHGLVVTDSMAMAAVQKYPNNIVRALTAGADIVLVPPQPKKAYAQVLAALKKDSTFRERVSDAARRAHILFAVREMHAQ